VSWHNKEMPTEGLEQLAREGIILEQSYSQQVCTPSRAALLTGKYPFHIGRQKRALKPLQPTGLTVNRTTLPDQLKLLGYNTHMVGKWHLGYCSVDYTPTRRGFDSFLGFYLGSQSYFKHDRDYKTQPSDLPTFYDFRNDEKVAKQYKNQYSTTIFRDRTLELLDSVSAERELNAYGNYNPFFIYLSFQATHAPLQARQSSLDKIKKSDNPARDIYKAMVADMDSAVTSVVNKLKKLDLYNNTVIVFSTDNGGAISHGASNFPLRGTKGTMFEGGTRAVSFVHAPNLLQKTGYTNRRLIHITDWMPTLLNIAGYKGDPVSELGLDGVDQWASLSLDNEDARKEMVYNLKVGPVSGAIRLGDYKLLFGKKFNKQGWYDVDNTALHCDRFYKNKKEKRKAAAEQKEKKEERNKRKVKEAKKKDRKGREISTKREKKLQSRKKKQRRKTKKRDKKREKKKEKKREKKREKKEQRRAEERTENKLTKIWKDWLPEPSVHIQNIIRGRISDCNWSRFFDAGHSDNFTLAPRNGGDIVTIMGSAPNPFNITAEDEDTEFEPDLYQARGFSGSLEQQFDDADSALYNIKEDPEERNDLKQQHPDIFVELRSRVLFHLENIVPEDFPSQDFSGHPRYFDGVFSPGWCQPK